MEIHRKMTVTMEATASAIPQAQFGAQQIHNATCCRRDVVIDAGNSNENEG